MREKWLGRLSLQANHQSARHIKFPRDDSLRNLDLFKVEYLSMLLPPHGSCKLLETFTVL